MIAKPKLGRRKILVDVVRYSISAQSADIEYAHQHFVTPSQAFRELIAAHRKITAIELSEITRPGDAWRETIARVKQRN